MKPYLSVLFVASLALSALPRAQEQANVPDAARVVVDPEDVLVKVGDMYGRIIAIDGDQVQLSFESIPGSRATLSKELVPAEKLYLYQKARLDNDDPQAWLGLAQRAREWGLYTRRIEALRAAAALQPGQQQEQEIDEQVAQTRDACATDRLGAARELRDAGELEAAIAHLEDTIESYEECGAGERARALLEEIQSRRSEEEARAAEIRETRSAVRAENSELSRARELIDRGDRSLQHGLENLDDYVDAERAFETALAAYGRARDVLERSVGRGGDDELPTQVAQERDRLMDEIVRKQVRAHVELGHVYLARGDEPSAYRQAGLAASLDPDSPRVERLRAVTSSREGGG